VRRAFFFFVALAGACTAFGSSQTDAPPSTPDAGGEGQPGDASSDGYRGSDEAGTRFVFVTAGRFTGGEVADEECQKAGDRSPLLKGRTFKAWISDRTANAKVRLKGYGPWYLPGDGGRVAYDLDTLIERPINVDETGRTLDPSAEDRNVWTGTTVDFVAGNTCESWSIADASALGQAGHFDERGGGWTDFFPLACDESHHLYCFEQAPP
jgi:hypothetical protein